MRRCEIWKNDFTISERRNTKTMKSEDNSVIASGNDREFNAIQVLFGFLNRIHHMQSIIDSSIFENLFHFERFFRFSTKKNSPSLLFENPMRFENQNKPDKQ